MADIIQELRGTETFDSGISKLYDFLQKHPQLSLDYYIKDLSPNFQNMIRNNLESYRDSASETGSTPISSKPKMNNWTNNQEQPQDRPSFGGSRMSNPTSFNQQPRFQTQKEPPRFSSGLKQPNSNRPSNATIPETGNAIKQDLNSSSDRINQYQNKLSAMREKFQQKKSGLDGQTEQKEAEPKSATSKFGALQKNQSQPMNKQNLNTSFSAMNTSLQQKWKAISKESKNTASARGEQFQTNIGRQTEGENELNAGNQGGGLASAANTNMTRSQNIMPVQRPSTGDGGATSNDLNRRLLEMKAKLAALKK